MLVILYLSDARANEVTREFWHSCATFVKKRPAKSGYVFGHPVSLLQILAGVFFIYYISIKFYNTYYGPHYLQELLYNTTGTSAPGEQEAVSTPREINIDKRKKTT